MISELTIANVLLTGLAKAWRRGSKNARRTIVVAALGISAAAGLIVGHAFSSLPSYVLPAAALLAAPSLFALLFVSATVTDEQNEEQRDQIKAAEIALRETPDKAGAAWEVARLNLQSYIDRNLSQISWMFGIILMVMLGGFILICVGVVKAWIDPENIKAPLIAAGSGIIVQFIGATFLVIYKSTNEQAREYVSMLERINAVGMSAQLIEGVDDRNNELRDVARIDLAKGLLTLYGQTATAAKKSRTK